MNHNDEELMQKLRDALKDDDGKERVFFEVKKRFMELAEEPCVDACSDGYCILDDAGCCFRRKGERQ